MIFYYNVGDFVKDKKRDLIIIDRKEFKDKKGKNQKRYKILCNKCGFKSEKFYRAGVYNEEYWIVENMLKKCNRGCPCCPKPCKVVVTEINSIWKTDYWMIEMGLDESFAKRYTRMANKKALCVCPYCKSSRYKSVDKIVRDKSIGCKTCGDGRSYPEKFIVGMLSQLNIKFKTEYSPDYIKPKRSDFYLPDYNLVIETDGELGHEGGLVHGYSKKPLEDYVEVDKWKDEQHKLNGVETIRVNCFESDMEYIKLNILNSELNELFDLSKVDWNQVDLYAWKTNLKWEVCDYWNNKEEWETTTDVAKVFNISSSTVTHYLNYGNKLKWCLYNGRDELVKSNRKNAKNNTMGKSVIVFKNQNYLGLFSSCHELDSLSEDLFGVKMNYSCIAKACRIGKEYKGFTLTYQKVE